MKTLVQCKGGWGRIQSEVRVQGLHVHNGIFIAIHRPIGQFDMWVASDLLTGMAITSSISKKLVVAKAEKLMDKYSDKYKGHQLHALKNLFSCGPNYDFKLLERIERKCVERGFSSVEEIEITGQFADEVYLKNK